MDLRLFFCVACGLIHDGLGELVGIGGASLRHAPSVPDRSSFATAPRFKLTHYHGLPNSCLEADAQLVGLGLERVVLVHRERDGSFSGRSRGFTAPRAPGFGSAWRHPLGIPFLLMYWQVQ